MFFTNNSPNLCVLTFCIMFRKKKYLFLAWLPRISVNWNEKYRPYSFQTLANISGNLQPYVVSSVSKDMGILYSHWALNWPEENLTTVLVQPYSINQSIWRFFNTKLVAFGLILEGGNCVVGTSEKGDTKRRGIRSVMSMLVWSLCRHLQVV